MAPDSPRLSRPTSHRGRRGPSRPSELKQANVQELIALLRAHNPCSRADLVRLSGLSAPTVSSAVEYLERKHLVRRLGLGASNGGRPPDMLEFNADFGYIAGVDLGGTSIRLALADLNGRIIARWNVSTHGHRTPDKIVTLIQQGLRRLLTQNKLPHSRLLALGVGAPGITDVRAGVVLSAPHLSNWQNVPLRELLENKLRTAVIIENDVNTAALGESWCGSAKGVSNFVFLAIGAGIGAGIYINHNLYHGSDWTAGEVGYLLVPGTSLSPVAMDKPGALENAISGPAIEQTWRKMCVSSRESANSHLKATEIFELAEAGDARAHKLLEFTAQTLANAVSNISLLLNTSLVVLGGAIGTSGPLFQATRRLLARNDFARPHLAISLLKEDAQLFGALGLALEHVEANVLGVRSGR